MEYCGPLGVPHSVFKAWDQLDQDKALAWRRREQETHTCGIHPDVWDTERGGDPEDLRRATRICGACEIAEPAAAEFEKSRLPGSYQVWEIGPKA